MSDVTLNFVADIAQQAGHIIADLRDRLDISFKGDTELVTQADIAADTAIRQRIQEAFPAHSILSEELAPDADTNAEHLWVIDPIDGTVNYAHQHPQVAVSIAYYERGEARLAVVFNPFLHETFSAEAGHGAWLNGQPIRCSETRDLRRAIVATGFPYHKNTVPLLMKRVQNVLSECADIRRLGSAALDICWVACGRLDAYYETVKPWDFAAAQLIAREAGARFGHFTPVPAGKNPQLWGEDILLANRALYDALQQLLNKD
ncbi:inositol monophosphatase family protein [Thalassolituus sp. LLYu03]|uniref:inositol monophosphatase family protein n=1 Tax=Thalassolituus sp. LLYu03 TaxID=3421656 RepID=UPI003D284299